MSTRVRASEVVAVKPRGGPLGTVKDNNCVSKHACEHSLALIVVLTIFTCRNVHFTCEWASCCGVCSYLAPVGGMGLEIADSDCVCEHRLMHSSS